MRIDVFSIFPDMVDGFCSQSLLGRARSNGHVDLRCHDIRAHATDVHRTV
ncbi:MAG: tRNA ((1)-)-methyltransferase, partial [Actinomycetota bacterium]